MLESKIIEISKSDLETLYTHNSNKKVCEILKISPATLLKYLKQAGITLKGKGNGKSDRGAKLKII